PPRRWRARAGHGRSRHPAVWQRRWTSAYCRRPSGRTACRLPPQGTLLRGLRKVLAWTRSSWVKVCRWHLAAVATIEIRHFRWRLQGNATLGLRAGGRGHSLFFLAETRVGSWHIATFRGDAQFSRFRSEADIQRG